MGICPGAKPGKSFIPYWMEKAKKKLKKGIIMISIHELSKLNDINDDLEIICTDGQSIIGKVVSIDDEDESGLGECGISLVTRTGDFVGIGQSEIKSINEIMQIMPEAQHRLNMEDK